MTRVSLAARHKLPIDVFPRVQAVCLDSPAQVRMWLEDLINGEDHERQGNKLILSSGIVIDSPQLDLILSGTGKEGIEDRYARQNLQFRRGPWEIQPKADVTPKADPVPRKPAGPKKPDGFITVAEIAAQLGVKPFDVRQALRNSGAVKPKFGWAFSPSEVVAVKKLIAQTS